MRTAIIASLLFFALGVGLVIVAETRSTPRARVVLAAVGPFSPLPPGSCHAAGGGIFPDATCTPGATNPDVIQATIGQTICVSGWTSTIRPPQAVTGPEKVGSMAAYGDGTDTASFEYDHLISLELGGAPNDNRNLWPEPHTVSTYGSTVKDTVENALKHAICAGQLSLVAAQEIIARNWTRGLKYAGSSLPALPDPSAPPTPTPTTPTTPTPTTPTTDADHADDHRECGC